MTDLFKDKAHMGSLPVGKTAILTVNSKGPVEVLAVELTGTPMESYQAMSSFGNDVYVTLFGPALTLYTLTCHSVPKSEMCSNDEGTSKLDSLKDVYSKYRIGADDRPVIKLSVDSLDIKGFMVAMPITVKEAGVILYRLQILGQVIL